MTFRIHVLRRANRDVDHFLSWISHDRKSPQGAVRWYRAYEMALDRLARVADQQPLAPENEFADFEVRHMTFKTRRGRPYRLLFTLADREVRGLHVRGPGQDLVSADELNSGNT